MIKDTDDQITSQATPIETSPIQDTWSELQHQRVDACCKYSHVISSFNSSFKTIIDNRRVTSYSTEDKEKFAEIISRLHRTRPKGLQMR